MKRTIALTALALPYVLAAQVPIGPDAPDMAITYDPEGGEFTYTLSNSPGSNNYGEGYSEWIDEPVSTPDPYWRFQGYAIYQFRSQADADDSLHLVIRDPERARPVIFIDKADTIFSMLDNVYSTAQDSCTPETFFLDNQGLTGPFINSHEPFTSLGYNADENYCFLAVAFGFNWYHEHATCDTLQQVIYSKRAPGGALQATCIDLATVGMTEHTQADITISPVPAAESFTFVGRAGTRYRLRCVSMLGALVMDRTISTGDAISVSTWANGTYRVLAMDARGRMTSRTLVVEH